MCSKFCDDRCHTIIIDKWLLQGKPKPGPWLRADRQIVGIICPFPQVLLGDKNHTIDISMKQSASCRTIILYKPLWLEQGPV